MAEPVGDSPPALPEPVQRETKRQSPVVCAVLVLLLGVTFTKHCLALSTADRVRTSLTSEDTLLWPEIPGGPGVVQATI